MIGYVFKGNQLAATIQRDGAHTVTEYLPPYLASGAPAIASTLPLSSTPVITPGGAVPAFFAGLLPEGRRLSALVRNIKTSADDELGLLCAVGPATVGDVHVQATSNPAHEQATVRIPAKAEHLNFADIITEQGISLNPRLAGVQDKASAQMISFHASKAGVEYLIKFDPPEYRHLCRNEAYFLRLAKKLKLPVAQSKLLTDNSGAEALLVKRFDRSGPLQLHLEDGAQVLGRYPADKYLLSFEEVAAGLANTTISPVASAINLLTQLAFAWLTGNGDAHAKNFSMVSGEQGALIAPMYDLPSSVFYPELNPELALSVGGQDTLTVSRFIETGAQLGLQVAALENIRAKVLHVTSGLADDIEAGALPFDYKITAKAARQLRRRHADFSTGA